MNRIQKSYPLEIYLETMENFHSGPFRDHIQKKFFGYEFQEKVRILRWFKYLNRNYNSGPKLYSGLISLIVDHYDSLPYVKNQTLFELQNSLYFLDRVFRMRKYFPENSENIHRWILTLALIYGKYYYLQQKSIGEWFKDKEYINVDSFIEFFEYLFVKYESPKFLIQNMLSLSEEEIGFLMHLVSGKNARTFKKIPIPLSKKDSFYLNQFIQFKRDNWTYEFKRLFIIAKLLSSGVDEKYVMLIVYKSATFYDDLERFSTNIDKWKHFLRMVKTELKQVQGHSIRDFEFRLMDVVDFIEYKIQNDPTFSFKGRTMKSLHRASREWHIQIREISIEKLMHHEWSIGDESIIVIEYDRETWFFEELCKMAHL